MSPKKKYFEEMLFSNLSILCTHCFSFWPKKVFVSKRVGIEMEIK